MEQRRKFQNNKSIETLTENHQAMKPTVYVESSVIGYLTARPSRDVVTAARQAITAQWWKRHRGRYELFISALVEEEISQGDPEAAEKRLVLADGIPALDVTERANALAKGLIARGVVPRSSEEDALHIGIAAAAGMDYLLTWNFKHINNAETKGAIARVVEHNGFACPVLCSPEELGG
uniref:PIN domain-containing protein n=1 Tax=Candidatus Kentrum sp. FW TaxID=2126338 RepID=A0A450SF04_9GAMM|nr:MAG: hypothetical protein BECKFW1821A_GA0114235_10318 [Candidatus Kentron sp. FW]VFJ59636.1 MAG: hypothetical protein BECKFW1821B_GA0114236_10499 [Candidatus Kentron sp. FW]